MNYDPVENEIKHDKLIEVFTGDFLAQDTGAESICPSPIFILGMPRSGSTLIEQILASHSMVEGTGELPYIIMLSAALGQNRSNDLDYPEVLRKMDGEQPIYKDAIGYWKNYESNVKELLEVLTPILS